MTITMEQPKARRQRSDRGSVRQTARDVHLLTWIAQQYAVPMDLLAVLMGKREGAGPRDLTTAYALVNRWKKAGWVQSGQVDAGPAWVWPTQSTAAAYLERKVTNWRPGLARVAHLRAAAAVRLHRTGADLTRWIGERELTTSQFLAKGDKPGHRPDGIEVLPDGQRVAIEIELTPKNPQRYWDPEKESGLLTEVRSAALNAIGGPRNRSGEVAYWCTREARPVLARAIEQYQRNERIKRNRDPKYDISIRWHLMDIEEVPGWKWSTEAE